MTESTTSEKGYDLETLEATRETALDALARAGNRAADLIEAWIRHGNAAAVAEAAERSSGPTRKAARRGLNVLRARGATVPEKPRVSVVTPAKAEETFDAWLLAPDASGSVLLVLAAHTPSSRYRTVFVHVNETFGVQRVDYAEVAWSQLRETLNRTAAASGVKSVKVPVPWARARIARARERNRELRILEPLGLERGKTLLEPVPETLPAHPLDEEGLELTIEDAREVAKASAVLHRLPEFRGWMPPREAVDEMMVAVGKSLKPGQPPESSGVETLLRQEIDAATDRFFSPQRRESLVESMKDSALSVLERDGEQAALEVVAALTCIKQAGLITDPPHEIPFLRGFFEKAVSALAAEGRGSIRIPVPAAPPEETPPEPGAGPLVVPTEVLEAARAGVGRSGGTEAEEEKPGVEREGAAAGDPGATSLVEAGAAPAPGAEPAAEAAAPSPSCVPATPSSSPGARATDDMDGGWNEGEQ